VHAGLGAQQAEGVVALDLDGRALDASIWVLKPLRSAYFRYWRSSMLAQSQASVPPAPAWMSMKALSGSAGLLNIRRNSSCLMSCSSEAASSAMACRPSMSPSSFDIS
jgi:hypothetical protein